VAAVHLAAYLSKAAASSIFLSFLVATGSTALPTTKCAAAAVRLDKRKNCAACVLQERLDKRMSELVGSVAKMEIPANRYVCAVCV
jgi:hypothetical protein